MRAETEIDRQLSNQAPMGNSANFVQQFHFGLRFASSLIVDCEMLCARRKKVNFFISQAERILLPSFRELDDYFSY